MTLRVLLCDDRVLVLDGLRMLLDQEPDIEVVGATDNGIEAMALTREHRPHVVVIGPSLRQMPGLELTEKLRKETLDPLPEVIVLTGQQDDADLSQVLRSGASGLLGDDAGRDELALAVRAVARGQAMLGPHATERLMTWFRERTPPDEERSELLGNTVLTPREREILILTAQGLSTEDIASKLYISTTTVRTHLYRLRSKLQLRDRAQLVSFAFRSGIVEE